MQICITDRLSQLRVPTQWNTMQLLSDCMYTMWLQIKDIAYNEIKLHCKIIFIELSYFSIYVPVSEEKRRVNDTQETLFRNMIEKTEHE